MTEEFVEPEFWTILKTPWKEKVAVPSNTMFMMLCDGVSSRYTITGFTAGSVGQVHVNNMLPNEYSVITDNAGLITIDFPAAPQCGTIIRVIS